MGPMSYQCRFGVARISLPGNRSSAGRGQVSRRTLVLFHGTLSSPIPILTHPYLFGLPTVPLLDCLFHRVVGHFSDFLAVVILPDGRSKRYKFSAPQGQS
jgi:hypothetical protein